jgi:aspartate carbamoyltransferase catalytic subunit
MARSLLDLDDLTHEEIDSILAASSRFRESGPARTLLAGVPVLNLFFEASTRTVTSFTVAAQRVGAEVISFAPGTSSLGKGETIADTALTLHAIGVRVIVVRHSESGFARRLSDDFEGHVINAGDGLHAHPTQALLDLMTLRNEFGRVGGLRVAIVGDILHSRVARSNIIGMRALGVEVVLVGPPTLLPTSFASLGVQIERDFDTVLPTVDAVMMLRIQQERIASGLLPSLDDYTQRYQLNARRLGILRRNTVVMHPGPYNRDVELTDDVLRDSRSRYAAQVANGTFVRMAVLDFLVNGESRSAA